MKTANSDKIRPSTGTRGMEHLAEHFVKKWRAVDDYYKWLSKPSKRKRVLDAMEEVKNFIGALYPLLVFDGRFAKEITRNGEPPLDIPYPGQLIRIVEWINRINPDGGRHPDLPMLACAHELSEAYRMNTGSPHWEVVAGRIIEAFGRPDLKDGNSPGEWIKKRVHHSRSWWKRFQERTLIETTERYHNRIYAYRRGEVSQEEKSRLKEKTRALALWHWQHTERLKAKLTPRKSMRSPAPAGEKPASATR